MAKKKKDEKKKDSLKQNFYLSRKLFINAQQTQNPAQAQQAVSGMLDSVQTSNLSGYHDLTAILANEVARILAPAKHQDSQHYIEMALKNAKKVDDRRIMRDTLYKCAGHYGSLDMNEKAVELYLKSRAYTDVFVEPDIELQELMETEDHSTYGLTGDRLYAMATFQAANHMDPTKKEVMNMYDEAKEYFAKVDEMQQFMTMIDYRKGMAHYAQGEYDTALQMLEEVKVHWEREMPDLIEQNNLEMLILAVKQKKPYG